MAALLDFKGPVLVFFLFDKKWLKFGANTAKHYPKLSLFEKSDKITFLNR